MKTYEGTMTIKWYKNDHGDMRPFTIDCEDIKAALKNTTKTFMELGENGRLPFKVTFDLSERK